MFWTGAAALTIAQKCEENGYKTQIVIGDTSHGLYRDCTLGARATFSTGYHAKRFEDVFDKATLVNSMGAWFLRSIKFALWRTLVRRDLGKEVASGLGRPTIAPPEVLRALTDDDDCYYLAQIASADGAINAVHTTLKTIAERHIDAEGKPLY